MNGQTTTLGSGPALRFGGNRLLVLYLAVAVAGTGLGAGLAQMDQPVYRWGLGLLAGGALLALPWWLLQRWLTAPARQLLESLQPSGAGPAPARPGRGGAWAELAGRCQALHRRVATLEAESDQQRRVLDEARRQAEDLRRALAQQQRELAEREDSAQREARYGEVQAGQIAQLLDSVNLAAAGDLTQTVAIQGDSPIGQVGTVLGQFLGKLRVSIAMIGNHAYSLDDATGRLQEINQTVNRDALDTAAQAGQAASGARQVSHNLETVAGAAQTLNRSIEGIARNTTEAVSVAGAAVDTAGRTNATIASLVRSSAEIGNVVKLIGSIAGQTNLLALNATIEATRAGEAGKGFAVVANEVKDLARATARATEDITTRVQVIRADAAEAIEAIGDISGIIGRISELQQAIAAAVEEQTETTRAIGRTVAAAADGGRDIAARIKTVAAAAERTTAATQESRQAADEMAALAAKLLELVGQFHYEMRGHRGSPPRGNERRGRQPPQGIGS